MVTLYVYNIDSPNVKMPRGDEGVNERFVLGGYTYPGGRREAVLNNQVITPHNNNISNLPNATPIGNY